MSDRDDPDEFLIKFGECVEDLQRLRAEVAEARMVLRQVYAADEPLTLPALARKVVAKVPR